MNVAGFLERFRAKQRQMIDAQREQYEIMWTELLDIGRSHVTHKIIGKTAIRTALYQTFGQMDGWDAAIADAVGWLEHEGFDVQEEVAVFTGRDSDGDAYYEAGFRVSWTAAD